MSGPWSPDDLLPLHLRRPPVSAKTRCGWCETFNPAENDHCVNCGGPLRVAGSPGPTPPAIPRTVPPQFARRVGASQRSFGLAFGAVGVIVSMGFFFGTLLVPFMALGLLISLPFILVGALIVRSGRVAAGRRVEVLREGRCALGTVSEVRSEAQRGWRLRYSFEAEGAPQTGSVLSTDAEITRFAPGTEIHVVWIAGDPARSDLWPPLG